MFNFAEGQTVALKEDNTQLGLRAGDQGVIWALYDHDPPMYEVTFKTDDGLEIDFSVAEDEIRAVSRRWKTKLGDRTQEPHPVT